MVESLNPMTSNGCITSKQVWTCTFIVCQPSQCQTANHNPINRHVHTLLSLLMHWDDNGEEKFRIPPSNQIPISLTPIESKN